MTNKRKVITQELENGKLPPQSIELEEAVLGAILLENDALHIAMDILTKEAFYKEQNGKVFEAIVNLFNRSEPIDILTVTQELKRIGQLEFIGGSYYVSSLTNRIASSANIEFHARIVLQSAIKRSIILNGTNLIKEAYDDTTDVFDLIDIWEKNLNSLTNKICANRATDSQSLYDKILEETKSIRKNPSSVIGVDSGFKDFNRLMNGWQKSDLAILAARPGMGKTALMLCFARAAVKSKSPTAIFSLEMSAIQLYKRMSSQETDIPHEVFKSGMDSDTEKLFIRDMEYFKTCPLYIDDEGGISIFQLRNKARKLKREKNIELIIIDYLQLMSGGTKDGNREQEVSAISRGLKALAKELDVPIIALSQLSRQVENRAGNGKIPQLSDLRDSGSIEQDADMVFFIYRPEYYGIGFDADNNPTNGLAKIITAKNRHGPLDDINLKWIGGLMKFTDMYQTDHKLETNNDFLTQ